MRWTREKASTDRNIASPASGTTKERGDQAEQAALAYLQGHGLRLVQRNFKSPGRGGGEVDLIMREPDGTLVFVEVRQRSGATRGGAAASITPLKQRRIVFAARHFLQRFGSEPPCRFDVVLIQGALVAVGTGCAAGAATRGAAAAAGIDWLRGAFDAGAAF